MTLSFVYPAARLAISTRFLERHTPTLSPYLRAVLKPVQSRTQLAQPATSTYHPHLTTTHTTTATSHSLLAETNS